MTARVRQAVAGILREFTGRKIRLLVDVHQKRENNHFAHVIITNIDSNPILALR